MCGGVDQTGSWIREAQAGDQLAISKLLTKFHPLLRARVQARMDQALKSKHEPEDILQDVYLHVFRSFEQFENRGADSFVNWVYTIVDDKLIDAHRAIHRQVRDVAREVPAIQGAYGESCLNLLSQVMDQPDTPSRVIRREEAVGAVLACLSSLTETHRQVLRMRFLMGISLGETAERLGKSEAAVAALTQRALKALRISMNRMGEFTRGA